MTLIVAIGCSDGVVLASDSCSTDLDNRTKQPVDKIKRIPGQAILWGGSGSGGLIDRIGEELGISERGSCTRSESSMTHGFSRWVRHPCSA
jgi:hypothetical protein